MVYLVQFMFVALFMLEKPDIREGNFFYDFLTNFQIIVGFFVSVGFLIYGINLYCSTTSTNQTTPFQDTDEINKYLFVMLAFTLCFSLRIAMFLYRPITDHYMKDNLFPVLEY
eukprot:TRINITY_DN16747_c0_g2_i1.p1 TRINITY_DN16747_c0_g2~~TRINITY_DN16747_c0_g2_i1.p1  ORF type:complete len:113 (+),score=15.92 TRINITY_DN16747_c0_g2_i1:423-761(+)